MRRLLSILTAIVCAGATGLAQNAPTPTALNAIKLLPKGEAKRLARIQALEGTPEPDRWHFLVFDPRAQSGVHEYVITGDEVIASRSVSQFAETLKESDVVGTEIIKIDSDKVAKLAQQYARANNAKIATLSYELLREGEGAAPIWRVTCLDEANQKVAALVLTATKGTMVSHDGFPAEPVLPKEKLAVQASNEVATTEPAAEPVAENAELDEADEAAANVSATKKSSTPKSRTRSSKESSSRRSDAGFFHRAGGKLQKFFTGRDTLSR